MSIADQPLADVTVHAPSTRLIGVKAMNVESRSWIEQFPECPALNQYQMLHVGIMTAFVPTKIVRTKQTTTYFLACLSGRGKVLIDGRWRFCEKGSACLLPAHTLNAFEAVSKVPWEFCWVCYQQPVGKRPVADVTSPVIAAYLAQPLHSSILGLIHECNSVSEPSVIHRWVELIHTYVMRFAQPLQQDDRLRLLWDRVSSHLVEDWSLTRLVQESGYSKEHLRRLCWNQLGRSPMHQVTYMRMRKAAELLASTSQTIECIAQKVGYQNPFVFSNAFTKWIGWRPSEYRRKKLVSGSNGSLPSEAID